MQPYMNPNYFNQYQNNFVPQFQPTTLNGMYVESRAVVDSTQSDLSGKPIFLPTTDGNTIYVKQLDGFGKSHVTTYVKQLETQNCEESVKNDVKTQDFDMLVSKLDELAEKIDKLKPTRSTKKEVENE